MSLTTQILNQAIGKNFNCKVIPIRPADRRIADFAWAIFDSYGRDHNYSIEQDDTCCEESRYTFYVVAKDDKVATLTQEAVDEIKVHLKTILKVALKSWKSTGKVSNILTAGAQYLGVEVAVQNYKLLKLKLNELI